MTNEQLENEYRIIHRMKLELIHETLKFEQEKKTFYNYIDQINFYQTTLDVLENWKYKQHIEKETGEKLEIPTSTPENIHDTQLENQILKRRLYEVISWYSARDEFFTTNPYPFHTQIMNHIKNISWQFWWGDSDQEYDSWWYEGMKNFKENKDVKDNLRNDMYDN
tara:strand:+ start:435 stop:932 length:498 start_codon:yes stop_codon:yes gene_type:complete